MLSINVIILLVFVAHICANYDNTSLKNPSSSSSPPSNCASPKNMLYFRGVDSLTWSFRSHSISCGMSFEGSWQERHDSYDDAIGIGVAAELYSSRFPAEDFVKIDSDNFLTKANVLSTSQSYCTAPTLLNFVVFGDINITVLGQEFELKDMRIGYGDFMSGKIWHLGGPKCRHMYDNNKGIAYLSCCGLVFHTLHREPNTFLVLTSLEEDRRKNYVARWSDESFNNPDRSRISGIVIQPKDGYPYRADGDRDRDRYQDRDQDPDRDRYRDRDRDRDQDRDRYRDRDRPRSQDRERDREPRGDRDGYRDRNRDQDDDWDRDRNRDVEMGEEKKKEPEVGDGDGSFSSGSPQRSHGSSPPRGGDQDGDGNDDMASEAGKSSVAAVAIISIFIGSRVIFGMFRFRCSASHVGKEPLLAIYS